MPALQAIGVKIAAVIVSVDRMEKGQNDKTAIMELQEEFGIKTFPIVNISQIIETVENMQLSGKMDELITPQIRNKISAYMDSYCVR